jgi:UDP-glucose:(heptosyl)LPS alpha-1,3-glucosyltransferase
VHVVGPTPDAAGALAAADVVMVASVWESGPLIVTEAMELGRPVVATPVGFVPELVVDGRTGRIVAGGDAGALAAAVADLLLAPEHAAALGEAGRERVSGWLDRGAAVDAVVAVYEAVRRR